MPPKQAFCLGLRPPDDVRADLGWRHRALALVDILSITRNSGSFIFSRHLYDEGQRCPRRGRGTATRNWWTGR